MDLDSVLGLNLNGKFSKRRFQVGKALDPRNESLHLMLHNKMILKKCLFRLNKDIQGYLMFKGGNLRTILKSIELLQHVESEQLLKYMLDLSEQKNSPCINFVAPKQRIPIAKTTLEHPRSFHF